VKDVLTNNDVEKRMDENEDKLAKQSDEATDRSASDVTADAAITANVKLKLAKDPMVSALKIDVDTNNRRVTLTGTVESEAEAKRAIQVAQAVDGVVQVSSVLTVKSS
jgi:osmotically-inducible protein OsmY